MRQTVSTNFQRFKLPVENLRLSPVAHLPAQSLFLKTLSNHTATKSQDNNIMCKKLNDRPVLLQNETRSFTPLALTIEKQKRKMAETEATHSENDENHNFSSTKLSTPTPVQLGAHHKKVESNKEESFENLRKKAQSLTRSQSSTKISHKKRKSTDSTGHFPKDKKMLLQTNVLQETNSKTILPLTNNFLRPLNIEQDLERPAMQQTSKPATQKHSIETSNPKKHNKEKTHIHAFGDEEKENKNSKIFANPYIEQLVKENARKLLEEQKRRREEELEKKRHESLKKDRIFQDSQKVREHNKIFFRPSAKKKGHRENYAWGVDQRKFTSTLYARKSVNEGTVKKKDKHHKLEEKERRNRLGLGHYDEDTLDHLRKRSKNKQETTPDNRDSSQEKNHDKRLVSKEEEQEVKLFMQDRRNKLEEQQHKKKILEECRKRKIQENLMKLREEQRYQANKTPTRIKLSKRTSSKNMRGRLSEGIPKESEFEECLYDNKLGKELSAEEEEDYEILYNEFRRIISGKQILSNKHKTEDALKSQDKFYTSERISYQTQQENQHKYFNGNRISEDHDSNDFRDSVNSTETLYRKELAKNRFLQLSKRYENVLHGAEATVGNEIGELDEQQQHYSNLNKHLSNDQQQQKQPLPNSFSPSKPEQNGTSSNKNQTKKPIIPAIQLPINNPIQVEPQQPVIHELETSNFSNENGVQDESINMAETQIGGSYNKIANNQTPDHKLRSQEDPQRTQTEKTKEGAQNQVHLPYSSGSSQHHKKIFGNYLAHSDQQMHHLLQDNYQDLDQEDNEEALLRNMEIIEAAAIFIQKNYRGYRTRKILRQYFQDICEDEEDGSEKYLAGHGNSNHLGVVGSYLDLEEGDYIEYPYEDAEGRRIFAGPDGQVFLVDRNGKILEVQELDEDEEAESEAVKEDKEQRLLMEKYGHKRTRSSDELQAGAEDSGERGYDFLTADRKGQQLQGRPKHPDNIGEGYAKYHNEEEEDIDIDEDMYQYYEDLNHKLLEEQLMTNKSNTSNLKNKLTQKEAIREGVATQEGDDQKRINKKADEIEKQTAHKLKPPKTNGKEPSENFKGKGLIRKGFAEDIDSDYDEFEDDYGDSHQPITNFELQNKRLQNELFQRLDHNTEFDKGRFDALKDYEERLDTNEFFSGDGYSVEYQQGRRSMSAGEFRHQNSELYTESSAQKIYHQEEDRSLEGHEIKLINPNNSHEKISGLSSPPASQSVLVTKHGSQSRNLSMNPHPLVEPKQEDDIPHPFKDQNISTAKQNLEAGRGNNLDKEEALGQEKVDLPQLEEVKTPDKKLVDMVSEGVNTSLPEIVTEGVQTAISPTGQNYLKKTVELTNLYQNEFIRFKEEEATRWNEIISQLNVLESLDSNLNSEAKSFMLNLRKQLEDNKKTLQGNFELQNIIKSAHSAYSEDNSILFDLESAIKRSSAINSNLQTQNLKGRSKTGKEMNFLNQSPNNFGLLASPTSMQYIQALSPSDYRYFKKVASFNKKQNLLIDTETINREQYPEGNIGGRPIEATPYSTRSEGQTNNLNIDLTQMRLAMGSEQLIREQSARALSHQSLSSPKLFEHTPVHLGSEEIEYEFADQESLGLFSREPFKEFTQKKFRELLKHENMEKLIKMREQALDVRHKTQVEYMNKMLESKRFSPRTFNNKKFELEKWVTKERQQIRKSKKEIERGWSSFADAIKRTERDLLFMKKAMGVGPEQRLANLSDMSIRNSFTDEENSVSGPKRKLFRNDSESDGDNSARYSKPPGEADLRSPHGHENVIKIIDRFEIGEDYSNINTNQPPANENPNKAINRYEKSQQSNQGAINTQDKLLSPSEKNVNLIKKSSSDDTHTQGLNLEKNFIAHHQRISAQPDDNSHEIEGDLDDHFIKYKSNESKSTQEIAAHGFEDLERELKALQDDPKDQENLPREQAAGSSKKTPQKEDLSKKGGSQQKNEIARKKDKEPEIEWEKTSILSTQKTDRYEIEDIAISSSDKISYNDFTSPIIRRPQNSPVDAAEIEIPTTFKQAVGEVEEDQSYDRKGPNGSSHYDATPKGKLLDFVDFETFEVVDKKESSEFHSTTQKQAPALSTGPEPLEEVKRGDFYNALNDSSKDFKLSQASKKGEERKEPMFNVSIENQDPSSGILPVHLDLSQIDDSKGHQPATHKAIERIMLLQQKHEELEKARSKKRGFICTQESVTQYLDALCQTIIESYKHEFLSNINIPIDQSVEEKLSNLHIYDLSQSESSFEVSRKSQQAILNVDLYLMVEEFLKDKHADSDDDILELELFHNKAIFDAFNEALDLHRPYGLKGVPYTWKAYHTSIPKPIYESDMKPILEKTKQRVQQWCSFVCGYLGTGEEILGEGFGPLNEEYLAQLKEERLARMLAQEVYEIEDKWIYYDDEQTEVQIEISDMIFDKLATETAECLYKILSDQRNEKRHS